MNRELVTIERRYGWRMLAWGALVAITLLLAAVVQALAASAFVAPETAPVTNSCRMALAAGERVRESFLAHSC
jgi:hypothetical protein